MRYLITPSLLNSWSWYLNCPESYEEKAREDFIKSLNRERIPSTEAMQKGIMFENLVKAIVNKKEIKESDYAKYIEGAKEIAEIVAGGQWQVKVYKDLTIGDIDFFLYGKVDVLRGAVAYDIKYTENYEAGKFFKSTQHSLYLECLGLNQFEYLISNGRDVWREPYNINEIQPIQIDIFEFISWLPEDWKQIYFDKWQSK